MSIESYKDEFSHRFHDVSMQVVDKIAGTQPAKELIRNVSHHLIERGVGLFQYNGLQEALDGTSPYLEQGYTPVIISSHKSHGEIAPAIHIMEAIMTQNPEHVREFLIPVAASMAGGQQGNVVKTLHEEALVPNMEARNIHAVPVVSDNDVRKRGMTKNVMVNGLSVYRKLRKEGMGMFVFFEGSVEGGRLNPATGEINGLREADSVMSDLLEMSKRKGMPLVFIPVGMTRTHRLFSADRKFFTPEWLTAMARNAINPNKKFAEVNVGMPIVTDQLNLKNIPQAVQNLAIAVASQLPIEERGLYKNSDYLLNT